MKSIRFRNAVRPGRVDTFWTPTQFLEGSWPVYVILNRRSGDAWVDQYEPGVGPIAERDGHWAMWEIGGVPSRAEAHTLVRKLKPLLRSELKQRGSASDEIADFCMMFDSEVDFGLAREIINPDAEWRDADGEEVYPEDAVLVRVFQAGEMGEIVAETSDWKLRAIARAIRSLNPRLIIPDLLTYLKRLRAELSSQ